MATNHSNNESDDVSADVDAEADTEQSALSKLGEYEVTRRGALAGIGSAAAIGGMGGASATTVQVNDLTGGNGIVLPGDDVPVLDINLLSDDQLLDVSGGAGLSDALYDTVTHGDYENRTLERHPQPAFGDDGQEVVPGDLLSEFSTQDRVFTSTYYDFDLEEDHLFQAAGFTDDDFFAANNDAGTYDTPYVCQFVPHGYTTSDGEGCDCVQTYDESNAQLTTTETDTSEDGTGPWTGEWEFDSSNSDDDTDIVTICVGISNNNGQTIDASNISVETEGAGNTGAANDATIQNGELCFDVSDNFTLGGAGAFVRVIVNGIPNDPVLGGIRFEDDDGNVIAESNPALSGSGLGEAVGPVAAPFSAVCDFTTDMCEVINPQLSVKVDSVGIGQTDVEADMSGDELPYTADDIEDVSGSPLGDDASDESIIVDENGSVPPEAQGNGYTIEYDPDADVVTITFAEHRTDVTLPNSGWLSAVQRCDLPRGDVAPCEEYECTGEEYGRERVTSGVEDLSQIGLQEDFDSLDDGNFIRLVGLSNVVDERTEDPLILSANWEPDEPNLNGHTGFIDAVSVFNIDSDDLTGVELQRQSRTGQASAQPLNVPDDLVRDSFNYRDVTPAPNGLLQVPLRGNEEPQVPFEKGDALRINRPGLDGVNLLARGAAVQTDNVADLVDDDANSGLLTESEAYRELELEEVNGVVPLDTNQDPILSGDFSQGPKYGIAVSSSQLGQNGFSTPTQILVGGRFNCGGEGEDPHVGTPLEMADGEWVDVTRDERVTFEIDEAASTGATVSSTVDNNGVFHPHPDDNSGQEVVVDILVDGCVEDSVLIAVENANFLAGLSDPAIESLLGAGLLDPVPVGEVVQAVLDADAEFDGTQSYAATTGNELDLTRIQDTAGNEATTFQVSSQSQNNVLTVDQTDGFVTIGTTVSAGETGTIEGETDLAAFDPNNGPTPGTATQAYEPNPDYFLAAAARPSLEHTANEFTNGEVIAYSGTGQETVVKVTHEDAPDGAQVDDICLDEPDIIAQALEDSINAAIGDQDHEPSVEVEHNPSWHSATGYLIWSTTLVESSFDQSVDVSSVEIGSFSDLVNAGVIEKPPLEVEEIADLERQDVQIALGLGTGGDFNEVNAETIVNDLDSNDPDYDRYAPRADPLDLVVAGDNNEFLGDNELTCNGLALGTCLDLLGCECPDETTDLHQDDVNVILFYDSEYSAVHERVEVGGFNGSAEFTDRPGAPNAVEGFLPCLVHADLLPRWKTCDERPDFEDIIYTRDENPLPFYEGFDIIEVKDSIIDEKMVEEWESQGEESEEAEVCRTIPETQIRPAGGVERGLLPEDTIVHNVYGDRFDGVTIRNEGSADLIDVNEHTLGIGNADERDWIHGGQLIGLEGASSNPNWPQNRPDLVTFIGQTPVPCTDIGYEYPGDYPIGNIPYDAEFDDAWMFTDDQQEEIWFGTNHETTCEVPVEDDLQLIATAHLSNNVEEGETLEYEIPPLYDHDSDGVYDAVRPTDESDDADGIVGATFQDRGIFFESHDDQGDLASDVGQVIIGEELPGGGGGNGEFPCSDYDCENGQVSTGGLVAAIGDWRDGNLTTQDLLTVIESWRGN